MKKLLTLLITLTITFGGLEVSGLENYETFKEDTYNSIMSFLESEDFDELCTEIYNTLSGTGDSAINNALNNDSGITFDFDGTKHNQESLIDKGEDFINDCFEAMETDIINSLSGKGSTNNCDRMLDEMENWVNGFTN